MVPSIDLIRSSDFSSQVTDFDRAILVMRHPLDSLMSFFNDMFRHTYST